MPKEMNYQFEQCDCECDYCGNEHTVNSSDWSEVNEELKSIGWINRTVGGEWYTFCCQDCYNEFKS